MLFSINLIIFIFNIETPKFYIFNLDALLSKSIFLNIFLLSICFLIVINGSNFIDGYNGLLIGQFFIILVIINFINYYYFNYELLMGIGYFINNIGETRDIKDKKTLAINWMKLYYESDESDEILENTNLQLLDYDKRWRNYRIQVNQPSVDEHRELLLDLMKQAYALRNG